MAVVTLSTGTGMGVTHAKDKQRQIRAAHETWVREAPTRKRKNREYYEKEERKRRTRLKDHIRQEINGASQIPFALENRPGRDDVPWLNAWLQTRGYVIVYRAETCDPLVDCRALRHRARPRYFVEYLQ